MASIQLHVPINNAHLPVLSIPVDDCNRFALNPLRWLRFLGYAIYGSHGHICSTQDASDRVNYELAIAGGTDYYFVSTGTPRLLDVFGLDDRTSDADTTETRAGFRDNIRDRDGSCIVTGAPAILCEAAHIYPHSKGSEYICRMLENRGNNSQLDICDINDVRNGLLLTQSLHRLFGLGEVAFLKTPNFAMHDNDVPPSRPAPGPPSTSPGRFILQHMKPQHESVELIAPHNRDCRLPADMSQFPPSIIVDMIYGCAAVEQWGIASTRSTIESLVEPIYYDKNEDEACLPTPAPEGSRTPVTPRSTRANKWANRHMDQSEPRLRPIDKAMEVVALLWSQSRPQRHEKPPPPQEEDMRQDRVHAWLQTQ